MRTQELLAARGVDGARQFFTRAFDFGYTRSLDETLGKWPQEAILEDTVRVVRRFKPQVIVSIFPTTAEAGTASIRRPESPRTRRSPPRPTPLASRPAEGCRRGRRGALSRDASSTDDATASRSPTGIIDPSSGKSLSSWRWRGAASIARRTWACCRSPGRSDARRLGRRSARRARWARKRGEGAARGARRGRQSVRGARPWNPAGDGAARRSLRRRRHAAARDRRRDRGRARARRAGASSKRSRPASRSCAPSSRRVTPMPRRKRLRAIVGCSVGRRTTAARRPRRTSGGPATFGEKLGSAEALAVASGWCSTPTPTRPP